MVDATTDALPYGMEASISRLRGIHGLPKGAEGLLYDVVTVGQTTFWRIIVDTPGESGYQIGAVLGGKPLQWKLLDEEEER